MSFIKSSSLFFTSFSPLWCSIIFIDLKSCFINESFIMTEKISIICIIVFFIISIIVLKLSLVQMNKENTVKYTIMEVREEKSVSSEYLLSYILPLIAFEFEIWHQVIIFLLFFLTLAFLCIRHNHFSINIVLELLGYRLFTCQVATIDGKVYEKKILSKRKLNGEIGDECYLKLLNNEISYEIV